ncbi:hypothetical protein [Streptomyces sp. NPDC001781]
MRTPSGRRAIDALPLPRPGTGEFLSPDEGDWRQVVRVTVEEPAGADAPLVPPPRLVPDRPSANGRSVVHTGQIRTTSGSPH